MKRKGINYDVGRVMSFNWRPDYDIKIIHKEIDIIKRDLHCNAIKICGQNIKRVVEATKYALSKDLEVWFSTELWNKDIDTTLKYTIKAAKAAQQIYDQWPEKIIFSFGTELTFFMNGIIKGRKFSNRIKNTNEITQSSEHNKKLNNYFTNLNSEVKKIFQGKTTYSSLIFEQVDWNIFDFIGIDHYWNEKIADKYISVIEKLSAFGKPIEITEFGFKTFSGADKLGELGEDNIDYKSFYLHQLPIIGKFIQPHKKFMNERNEDEQAQALIKQLQLIESVKVDGAFIQSFIFPLYPYNENPYFDLDSESYSLVKYLPNGKKGSIYPDMTWEPKQSFNAISEFYKKLIKK